MSSTRSICRGDSGITFPSFMNLWTNTNICWDVYYASLFNVEAQPRYNADELPTVQGDFNILLNNYISAGYSFTQPGDPKYNVFQEVILDICNRYPGGCDPFLQTWCPNNTSLKTISNNTGLINFCGCYIQGTPYKVDSNTLSQQCQPLCHRASSVKLPDGQGSTLQCNSNVCVIDNVSITAAQTSTSNTGSRSTNVSFTQVCRCPSGQCKCILSNNNFFGLVGDVSFNQVCGDGSSCFVVNENPNQPPVQVECPTNVIPPENEPGTVDISIWIPWIITLIAVFLVFLLFVI